MKYKKNSLYLFYFSTKGNKYIVKILKSRVNFCEVIVVERVILEIEEGDIEIGETFKTLKRNIHPIDDEVMLYEF